MIPLLCKEGKGEVEALVALVGGTIAFVKQLRRPLYPTFPPLTKGRDKRKHAK